MERRLLLNERLKFSKLNKMTIKQGGVNITLNIKTDIADPNIEISDKVLYMLEAYAEKQNLITNDFKKDQSQNLITAENPSDTKKSNELTELNNPNIKTITEPIENQSNSEINEKLIEKNPVLNISEPEKVDRVIVGNESQNKIQKIIDQKEEKQFSSPTKRVCFELSADFTPSKPKSAKSILKNSSIESSSNLPKLPIANSSSTQELNSSLNESPVSNVTVNPSQKPSKRRIEDYFIKIPKEKVLKVSHEIKTCTETDKNISNQTLTNEPTVSCTIPTESTQDINETETSSSVQTTNEIENLIQIQEEKNITTIQEHINSTLNSPPQINESLVLNSKDLCLKDLSSPISEDLVHSETKNENDEKLKKTSIDDSSMFSCRLCKMKLGNQRSLYEHVARVHGGKSGILNLTQMTKSNDENSDIDLDNNYNDDDEDLKPEDHIKKNKLTPYPNLAIRVAKVAYYTTKSAPNLKSNQIFSNGGIRGNFFSQERLQLRSCRIKMKLHSPKKNSSQIDQFLSQANIIDEFKPIDRNTTSVVQVSIKDPSHSIIDEVEIKKFFSSILSYIPINHVTRVEELAKENEIWLNPEDLIVLNQIILEAKQFGITLVNIKKNFEEKRNYKVKFTSIIKLIDLLIDNYLILPVGVVYRVYVAHEFKKHWVIQSFKNLKGRGGVKIEDKYEEEEESEESEVKTNQLSRGEGKRRVSPRKKIDDSLMVESTQKNFKPVCLIPRPWRYIDGLLNRPVLQKMLESVVIYLKNKPNSCLESICNNFSPFLQPIMTYELIEMLETLKCVQKVILTKEEECDLFSDFTNGSNRIQDTQIDEMSGDEIFSYNCTKNSIFILRQVFPN